MIKKLHDGDYDKYLDHQKEKLSIYLGHDKKKMALEKLALDHYRALINRLASYEIKGKTVLCLAARIGQEVKAFRDLGAFAVGIDLNPGPDNLYVHYGDFHDLVFPNHSADIIYTNSLDHTFDFHKLISEITRVLKEDGTLILEIQKGNNDGIRAEQYEACWWDSVQDVLSLFLSKGYKVDKRFDIDIPFKSVHFALCSKLKDVPEKLFDSPNIETRKDLAKLAHGMVIELGVATGDYSEELLQNPNVKRVYSVDQWANDTKHHTDQEYINVLHRFEKYGKRSIIIRRTFDQASSMFNQIFDFIYIDGYAHTGQEKGRTLDFWWPKLKPGGIFAGHDYHERWQPTIDSVNKFVNKHKLSLYLTKENNKMNPLEFPSWYVHKSKN